MVKSKEQLLQGRMNQLTKALAAREEEKAKKDQELLQVKITRADVDELMVKMGISESETASRILRQVGGKVSDAVRFCIFDFPELRL